MSNDSHKYEVSSPLVSVKYLARVKWQKYVPVEAFFFWQITVQLYWRAMSNVKTFQIMVYDAEFTARMTVIVFLVASVDRTENAPTCPEDSPLQCELHFRCFKVAQRCDGVQNCADGRDETGRLALRFSLFTSFLINPAQFEDEATSRVHSFCRLSFECHNVWWDEPAFLRFCPSVCDHLGRVRLPLSTRVPSSVC